MNQLVLDSFVSGYHVYQEAWTPLIGEELECQREPGNIEDVYAVALLNGGIKVGHVPHEISTMCSMFPRKGGAMICTITGNRRYSADLVQGGMVIPCK